MDDRHGHGVFECPVEACDVTIVGGYTDLLRHVREHPLATLVADDDTGESIVEQIKDARAAALKRDIRELFLTDE